MPKPKRVKDLEILASNLIGDGKAPNLYFVSDQGSIILVSRSFAIAYSVWRSISALVDRETALEDRQTGVLASVQPIEEGSTHLCTIDDTYWIMKKKEND